ncbi:hypothetical protein [Acrocarpospora catenulata]|uniref:hypothetical protein n=1 Tax=Acrocarpospora catenulata TaxID=2836182 RepID=UPI001BDA8C23|nr:hypothetical protein [Acrocarpospora catenulata]
MSRYLDNPAGRLQAMLSDLREIGPNTPVRHAWAKVLGIRADDLPEFVRRFGLLVSLPGQIRAEVDALEDVDPDMLLRHLPDVEAALEESLASPNAALGNVFAKYDSTALFALEACSDYLHRRRAESVISDDGLKEIVEKTRELIDYVLQSDIPDDLKTFLLTRLREIEQAVQDIQIRGTQALVDVLERTAGALAMRPGLYERLKVQEPVWSMFAAVLSIIASIAQVTAIMLTPGPSSSSEEVTGPPEARIQLVLTGDANADMGELTADDNA